MALRFQFDERKGTEALAYIATQWPGITVFYASKVLFFAEKKHLNTYGRPIVADTFVAMPNGPVPSTLYDFIRGNLGLSGEQPLAERISQFIADQAPRTLTPNQRNLIINNLAGLP
ncbi:SocA family protein [Sphingomonas sp. So64.6b]|uniref:Panacea domain-containing protein n=1 Tax=Sphingomonas sp. So64.6b TaxID=2997354 RepID=UPI00160130CE|nr:Panacea domain-containing protein [Sphingomonas sp. So64.6b]QNA83217.1 SocA family protein [Sphingomonas sp. So64.6b]